MKTTASYFLTLLIGLTLTTPVHSKVDDPFTLKGKVWSKFTLDLTEGADPESGFDVYRGFIDLAYQLDSQWSARIISDTRTSKAKIHLIDKQGAQTTIHNSYIQGVNVVFDGDQIRMGRIPNNYLSELHRILKTRWISQTLSHESKYFDAQLDGLSFRSRWKEFTFAYTVHDGRANGFGKALDQNTSSAFMVKYQKKNFGALLHGEVAKANTSEGVNGGSVFNAALFYSDPQARVALEWTQQDIENASPENAYGLTAYTYFNAKHGLYLRFFGGDDNWQDGQNLEYILGVGPTLRLNSKLTGALVYENRKATSSSANEDNETVNLLLAANF